MKIFTIGGHACTIGGIPVGYGSATPPPPPPPPQNLSLTVEGQAGIVSAEATYKDSANLWRTLVYPTDGSASGNKTLPYGTYVAVSLYSTSYYQVTGPYISGLSAVNMTSQGSAIPYQEGGGTRIGISGYLTADGLVRQSASAGPKTFTIYAVRGMTSHTLTGSGSGNGDRNGASENKVCLPFRMYNTHTSEYFPSSCRVIRKTGEVPTTAEVFEPIGLSAVGFSADICHTPEAASWSNPTMLTTFNFYSTGFQSSRFASDGSGTASGTIATNPSSGYINGLSSRTTADTALGFKAVYASEGSKTYGVVTVLGWTATAITK